MELLGPIEAFLAIALIRVSPSIGDSNGDLSTVSVDRSKLRRYKQVGISLANAILDRLSVTNMMLLLTA